MPTPKLKAVNPAPSWLNSDAKKIYKELIQVLKAKNTYNESDYLIQALFANSYSLLLQAQKELDRIGSYKQTIKAKTGCEYEQVRPEVAIIREQTEQLNKLSKKFGLTPSDYATLKVEQEEEDDPFRKLMNQ